MDGEDGCQEEEEDDFYEKTKRMEKMEKMEEMDDIEKIVFGRKMATHLRLQNFLVA